nr:acyl-ACP thioesterase [Tanacetum cinerariifolium]
VIQVYGKLCLEAYIVYVFLSYETLLCSKGKETRDIMAIEPLEKLPYGRFYVFVKLGAMEIGKISRLRQGSSNENMQPRVPVGKKVQNEIFMLGGALSPGDHVTFNHNDRRLDAIFYGLKHDNKVKYIRWILESAPHEVKEKYELASFPLEYCRKCRKDSVLKSLTSILELFPLAPNVYVLDVPAAKEGIPRSDNNSQERHHVIDSINEIITFLEHWNN